MEHSIDVTDMQGVRISNSDSIYQTNSIYSRSVRCPIEDNKNKKGVSFTISEASRYIYQYLINSQN